MNPELHRINRTSTMRDVAAYAGVSVKTVSRVFNEDPHVRPETRSRVERAMKELNYLPNSNATTFRQGHSAVIGVAVPDIVDPYFAAVAKAVDDTARKRGISTVVTSLGEDFTQEQVILEPLLRRKLTGLVLAPIGNSHAWLSRWQAHTPIIFIDRMPQDIVADSFTEDNEGGAFTATSHLITRGHRRIAYVGDSVHPATEQARFVGYHRAMEAEGIFAPELQIHDVTNRTKAQRAMTLLQNIPNPPTALFSSNSRCSMNLISALRDSSIAMISFGDFPMADLLNPSLSVIQQDPVQIGELAAERILDRTQYPLKKYQRDNVLDVHLVERESTAQVADPH